MSSSPRPMHVERTDDPTVMRWVCHDAGLGTAPSGPRVAPRTSPIGRLVADGLISDVAVHQGDIVVRARSADIWTSLEPLVRDALCNELDACAAFPDGHWLVTAVSGPAEVPAVADIQAIVDRAAGWLTATHGGAMTVASVGVDTVRLLAEGACDGCSQSSDTVLAIIAPAIRAEYPNLVDVVVGSGQMTQVKRSAGWVRFVRR